MNYQSMLVPLTLSLSLLGCSNKSDVAASTSGPVAADSTPVARSAGAVAPGPAGPAVTVARTTGVAASAVVSAAPAAASASAAAPSASASAAPAAGGDLTACCAALRAEASKPTTPAATRKQLTQAGNTCSALHQPVKTGKTPRAEALGQIAASGAGAVMPAACH